MDRQLGRLLGANGHAARRYIVELVEDPSCAAGLKLAVSINQQWEQRVALAEGCYVLRTNLTQWDPQTLWRTYIQLTQAQAAFRIHKRDLSLRPIWHQKQRGLRLTSWSASWPTSYGRPWSNGKPAPAWDALRAPSSTS